MTRALTLPQASIGKKAIVAVTGIVLFGFVIVHMLGNLQVFLGPEAMNAYAATLKGLPGPLWAARSFLLASVVAHVVLSLQLASEASAARPVGYRAVKPLGSTYSSRSMRYTGPLLAAFILYHIAHFTWPGVAMGDYAHQPHDVYANFVNGFRVPWVTAIYAVAQVLLGLHLYHGGWSLLQTLGLSHPRYDRLRNRVPQAIALGVVLGNLSMPLAVMLGVVE